MKIRLKDRGHTHPYNLLLSQIFRDPHSVTSGHVLFTRAQSSWLRINAKKDDKCYKNTVQVHFVFSKWTFTMSQRKIYAYNVTIT